MHMMKRKRDDDDKDESTEKKRANRAKNRFGYAVDDDDDDGNYNEDDDDFECNEDDEKDEDDDDVSSDVEEDDIVIMDGSAMTAARKRSLFEKISKKRSIALGKSEGALILAYRNDLLNFVLQTIELHAVSGHKTTDIMCIPPYVPPSLGVRTLSNLFYQCISDLKNQYNITGTFVTITPTTFGITVDATEWMKS